MTLKDIFHLSAHLYNSSRSFCSISCDPSSSGNTLFALGTLEYILLSSANKHTGQAAHLGRSFIKIKNRSGPKTDPWGTPLSTSNSSDSCPLITTFCFLFSKKAFIQLPTCPFIPCFSSFSNSAYAILNRMLYRNLGINKRWEI